MSAVTLFWFGSEAYVLHNSELAAITLPEKGDATGAIAAHIAALDPTPKVASIVYQPSGLDPIRAACQRGPRADLQKTLAVEFPAIANLATAWASLTPQAIEGAYSTLLFLESKPRLPRLASALADNGIAVRGAWPLPALLESLPPFTNAETPGIFVVTTATTACVYAILPNASRSFTLVNDVAAVHSAQHALNTARAYWEGGDTPPVHVVSIGEPWPLGEGLADISPVHHEPAELLARAASLPVRATSNFLPPDVTFPWTRVLHVAALLLFGYAALTGFLYFRDVRALQADTMRRAALAEDLRSQMSTLRGNRENVETDLAFVAEIPPSQRGVSRLLDTLVKAVPAAITVHSLAITDGTFTLEGTIHEGVGAQKGPYVDFYEALSRPELPWVLAETNRTAATTAEFIIAGTFK